MRASDLPELLEPGRRPVPAVRAVRHPRSGRIRGPGAAPGRGRAPNDRRTGGRPPAVAQCATSEASTVPVGSAFPLGCRPCGPRRHGRRGGRRDGRCRAFAARCGSAGRRSGHEHGSSGGPPDAHQRHRPARIAGRLSAGTGLGARFADPRPRSCRSRPRRVRVLRPAWRRCHPDATPRPDRRPDGHADGQWRCDTDAGSDTDTDTDTDTRPESRPDSRADPGSDPAADAGSYARPDPDAGPDTDPLTGTRDVIGS